MPIICWTCGEERPCVCGYLQELFAERAAIKEYLGNLPREVAEREAREEIYGK